MENITPLEVYEKHPQPRIPYVSGGDGQAPNDWMGWWGKQIAELSKQLARLCFLFPFYSLRLAVPQGFFWRGNKIKWVKQSHKPVKSERHVISSKRKKRTISMPKADSNA